MTTYQIQNLLAFLHAEYPTAGFSPGLPDGIWGPKTEAAVRAFQKSFGGLTVTGQADEATQKALRHAVAYGMELPEPENFWEEIEFFQREEFRCPCGNCGGFPVEPDEQLVTEVNDMRRVFGVPVIVVPPDGHSGGSGVRCQQYNATLKNSVPNSRHLLGKAVDFSAPGKGASAIEAYLARRQTAGGIRYWYRISPGSYHMDVE